MLDNTVTAIDTSTTATPETVAVDTSVNVSVDNSTPNVNVNVDKWFDKLPEDIRGAKAIQNFKDESDLAKSYLHLNKLLGDKVENWAAEDITKLYSKLGRPETADKYVLPPELGDGAAGVAELAHKLGLSQAQTNELVNDLVTKNRDSTAKAQSESEAVSKAWVDEIKQEFGTAFNERIELAKQAVNEFGGNELKTLLNETGLGSNPVIVKMFARIGKEFLQEGRVVKGDQAAVFGVIPQEAMNQISTLQHSKEFMDAFSNINHPRHKEVVAQWETLHTKAYS